MARVVGSEIMTNSHQQSFSLWKKAIEQRTGVRVTEDRERALGNLLSRRMQELQYDDPNQYFADSLDDAKGAEEWSRLVDSLLIKETSFFRHQPSLNYVTLWIQSLAKTSSLKKPQSDLTLWLWSLGCSSGEEAYSLAITMREAMKSLPHPLPFAIVATDISHKAIAEAKLGVYFHRKLRGVSAPLRQKYFDPIGADKYRVKNCLRGDICFLTSNILSSQSPLLQRKMDLIYCQNMLVYFRRWQRREIVSQLALQMQDESHMILGMGELGSWAPPNLTRSLPRTVQAYSRAAGNAGAKVSGVQQSSQPKLDKAIRRC